MFVTLGQQLERILESSNSLSDLSLYGIDTALTENLSNGLKSAKSLKTVRILMIDHDLETFVGNDCSYLAKLLKGIESSRSLLNMCVYEFPAICRHSTNSDWYLALSTDINSQFYSPREFPLLPIGSYVQYLISALTSIYAIMLQNLFYYPAQI